MQSGLQQGCLQSFACAEVFNDKSPAELTSALKGRSVAAVLRKGKYFWFELTGEGPHVLFHFGMTGHLAIKDVAGAKYVRLSAENGEWPPRFTKLQLSFDDGTKMAFADSRRFARVKLLHKPEAEEPISKLGPDAHLELPSLDEFQQLMAKHKRAVKAVLLDQAVLSGIGNWVGDEVLYQARLFPEQPCCELSAQDVQQLHTAIRDVLTLSVSVGADHKQFPEHWIFHYRWTGKTATKDFYGNAIKFITVGGRTTAYVPALQKLPPGRHSTAGPNAKITDGTEKAKGNKSKADEDAGNGLSGAGSKEKAPKAKKKRSAAADEDASPEGGEADAEGAAKPARATGKGKTAARGERKKGKVKGKAVEDEAVAASTEANEQPAADASKAADLPATAGPSASETVKGGQTKKGRKVAVSKAVAVSKEASLSPAIAGKASVRKKTRSQAAEIVPMHIDIGSGADLEVAKAGQGTKKRRGGASAAKQGEGEAAVQADATLPQGKKRKNN